MILPIMIKKFLITIIGFCCVSSASSLLISWYMVKKFTARPIYTDQRIAEHEQNRVLFFKDLNAQTINFKTADGILLSGFLIQRPDANRVILICHGYRMCKERMINMARMFPEDTILLFDHRAHGQSEGMITTFGYLEQIDILAAINFLKTCDKTENLPVIGIGVSMGAVSLLAAACQSNSFHALILDSPFLRLDRQARKLLAKRFKMPEFSFHLFGNHLFSLLMNFSMRDINALNWAKVINIPTLMIHSVCDDTVAFQDALTLFNAIPSQKKFWQVDMSGHARIFNDCFDEYKLQVHEFLTNLIN